MYALLRQMINRFKHQLYILITLYKLTYKYQLHKTKREMIRIYIFLINIFNKPI